MVERVLVKEMRLVEEKGRVNAVAAELLDMSRYGVEDGGGGRRRRETEGEADLAIEIATPEGGIVAIREAKAGLGNAMAQTAQDAGLADARVADEENGFVVRDGVGELIAELLFGGRKPELGVGDFLGKGRLAETEVGEIGCGGHRLSPLPRPRRPTALSRSAPGGSKSTEGLAVRRGLPGRLRREFATASTA